MTAIVANAADIRRLSNLERKMTVPLTQQFAEIPETP